MTDHPELKKLIEQAPNVPALIERAFRAGMEAGKKEGILEGAKLGAKAAIERVTKIIAETAATMPTTASSSGLAAGEATATAVAEVVIAPQSPEYGAIAKAVKTALKALSDQAVAPQNEGFGPADIFAYCKAHIRPSIDVAQIRNTLKVLARSGEAIRVERGKYRLASPMELAVFQTQSPSLRRPIIDDLEEEDPAQDTRS